MSVFLVLLKLLVYLAFTWTWNYIYIYIYNYMYRSDNCALQKLHPLCECNFYFEHPDRHSTVNYNLRITHDELKTRRRRRFFNENLEY